MRRWLGGVLVVLTLASAACSGSDGQDSSTPIVDDSEEPAAADPSPEPLGLNPAPRPAPTVPGQSVDSFDRASAGDIAIIGVSPANSLPMYALPGEQNPIVGEVAGDADDVVGLGEAFVDDDGELWWLLQSGGAQGWIKPGAAFLGARSDVTAEFGTLVGASVEDLAQAVADNIVASDGPFDSVVLIEAAEITNGFEGTATIDVVGLGDDALAGYRLLVDGSANATQGDEYALTGVTRILLCSRGLTPDGLCK